MISSKTVNIAPSIIHGRKIFKLTDRFEFKCFPKQSVKLTLRRSHTHVQTTPVSQQTIRLTVNKTVFDPIMDYAEK